MPSRVFSVIATMFLLINLITYIRRKNFTHFLNLGVGTKTRTVGKTGKKFGTSRVQCYLERNNSKSRVILDMDTNILSPEESSK